MVKASIVSKETHVSTTVTNIDGYVINVPSVIKLELQASQVRKIQLINGDLVVELMNGEIITIENFNDGTKNLDNSLVMLNGSSLVHINLPVNGDKEVNPQIDYLALGDVDTLLHHSESDSSIMPWLLAGGAVVAGGVAAASGGGSGSDGKNGVNGQDGKDGKDALNAFYDYASNNGFTGSETELVELIVSEGQNGLSAYEVAKSMGYTGTVEEWIISLQGAVGADGKSAFDLAKANGFSGTETEWLASLAGKDGESVILLDMPILTSESKTELSGIALPGVKISLYNSNGKLIGSAVADENGSWSLPNTLAPNQIGQLIASNDKGSVSLPLPVINIVENLPEPIVKPSLELIGVVDGEITGNATPGVTVNLYNSKGNVVGTANVGADGSWQIQNTLALDEIGTLIATDAKGNISLPLPIIELSKPEVTPPAPVIPTTDVPVVLEADIALKGTAEAGAIIKVLQNGNVIGQTVADQGGNWSFEVNPLPQGSFGGLVASVEGKTDSSAIIINGFVLHKTQDPVILESGDKLHGTAQAGATIKVFDYGTQQFVETTADENGVWSFDVNPIINDSFGYVIAQLEHYAESDAAVAHGPVTPQLEAPTVTYNNEDKLEGLSEAFAEITVDVAGSKFTTTADANGVWQFDFNPLLDNYGGISATLDGYFPSNVTFLYGVDTIAPNLKVELEINTLKTTFESLNSSNVGYLKFTLNDGQEYTQQLNLTNHTENAVNLLDYPYSNIQKIEFWVQDNVGNQSAVVDITHAYQKVDFSSASEATGFTGMGIADSTIELTHVASGQKFEVVTDALGNWNISNEVLNTAGISVFDNNDFTVTYLTIHGEVNNVKGQLQATAPVAVPLIDIEILEHTLDYILIKSEPNTVVLFKSIDPQSGVPLYGVPLTTNADGLAKLDVNTFYNYMPFKTFDFEVSVANGLGERTSVVSEQLYLKATSNELVLKIEGVANATYVMESGGVKTQFTTDSVGSYTFLPNPYPTVMFTIDRVDTSGTVDIPPQEFGAVVKEPAILGMVDGHLVFDVPLNNYVFKIYDENGLLITEAPVVSFNESKYSLELSAMKLALEGHKYGYGEVLVDSKFIEGKKYYLEYTNTESGGISGKLEFVLGEGGNVPQIDSIDPSYDYILNNEYGSHKVNINTDLADMIQFFIGDQMAGEYKLVNGQAEIDLGYTIGNAVTEIKFFKDGILNKSEAIDFQAEPPTLIIQGSDDRYIWGFSEGASHIAVNIGDKNKYMTIPVGQDGKFVIDTHTTLEIDRQHNFQLYAIGNNHVKGELQYAQEVTTNGNVFNLYDLSFSADYQTLYVNNALNMYPKNFKIVDFETGSIVLESQGIGNTNNRVGELDISGLNEGLYRVVVEKGSNQFHHVQLYINADGKAYVSHDVPTTGYNNTIYDVLKYADDLGGNEVTTHDLGADPDHHFNIHELLAHDYDSSKNIADFLSTVTSVDSETGQTSTSLWVDRDGTGDQFKSTELLILQNTDINLEQLLNNGTILY